jgi:hypothetical protein
LAVAVLILAGCGKDKPSESGASAGSTGGSAAPSVSAVPAAKTFTIKLKVYPDPGKTVRFTSIDTIKGSEKVSIGKGEAKERTRDDVSEKSRVQSIVEPGNPRPQKYKETFEKALVKSGDQTTIRPLQGRTILYEDIGEKYKITVEGAALPKQDTESLASIANKGGLDQALVPSKPVSVGESWTVDAQTAGATLGHGAEVDAGKSKVEAKLVRVYDKAGKPYAAIEFTLKIAYKRFARLTCDPPLMVEAKGTLDAVRDGSSTFRKLVMSGKIAGKGHPEQKGAGTVTVEVDETLTGDDEHSEEK